MPQEGWAAMAVNGHDLGSGRFGGERRRALGSPEIGKAGPGPIQGVKTLDDPADALSDPSGVAICMPTVHHLSG